MKIGEESVKIGKGFFKRHLTIFSTLIDIVDEIFLEVSKWLNFRAKIQQGQQICKWDTF